MEKLAGEIAKKMLSAAWTLMRAAEAVTSGSRTVQAPLLGALLASTIGKERPPLVERRILTLAALIGALVVPATFQVMVCAPDNVTAVAGEVTTNGPALVVTVICVSAAAVAPPVCRLSRAVTRKFIVRLVVGNLSPGVVVWLRTSDNCGKVRAGLVVGLNERNRGLLPLSGALKRDRGTEIALFPAIGQRVAIRVAARRREGEGRAHRDGVAGSGIYCRRGVAGAADGGWGVAGAGSRVAEDLFHAGRMEVGAAMRLQVVGAANARIGHDRRAAARFVGLAAQRLP